MDLYTLNNSFYLEDEVKEFDSLIWTERFTTTGDFKLETSKIDEMRELIPTGSCVGILQSNEVMYVDTHEITRDEDNRYKLTISGKSFESFFQYRTNAVGLGYIGSDVTEVTSSTETAFQPTSPAWAINLAFGVFGGWADIKDVVPNLLFDIAVTNTSPKQFRKETLSNNLYDRLKELLDEASAGIQNVRPTPPDEYLITRFYNGVDRSASVILDEGEGHFKTSSFIETKAGTYTVAYGRSDKIVGQRYAKWAVSESGGLHRRVLYVDCTDIKEDTAAKEQSLMAARMDAALNSASYKGTILDCDVSPTIPYEYNKHYFLGDTIMCTARFGVRQKMMVTEFIRSQDSSGEVGYPSLVTV